MTLTVAIVGGGPRGLWAAEELTRLARERGVDFALDVYDDARPGPYDGDQPDYWLVNVRSAIIRSGIGTFDDWRAARGEAQPLAQFPPRRLVGEFLRDSWADLDGVTHIAARVEAVAPGAQGGWLIDGRRYDEVLIATGHADDWPGALPEAISPYPMANLEDIAAGSTVAVRGASLTFLDAALALTLGRGGRFTEGADSFLEYVPSGQEPAVIVPYTRSGRLMEVKPDPPTAEETAQIVAPARPRILAAETTVELLAVLGDVALAFADEHVTRAEIDAVLAGEDPVGPQDEMLRSGLRGERSARIGAGLAWRELYPEIVEIASYGGRLNFEGFTELAARLERLAFGPPQINSARLLALIEAGVVTLTHLDAGAPPEEADTIIDAVLAPARVLPGTLEHALVQSGVAQLWPGTQSLAVEPDATLVGQHHIAAVGRMTEEVVLGNDTLSRTLHDVIPTWARRVLAEHGPDTGVHGTPPMTARLEPWARELSQDPARARDLLERFGSPVNVLHTAAMRRNAAELVDAGTAAGVDLRVFYARKANKALAFVDTARDAGHGVDVASHRELAQTLEAGVPGERLILSAAIKPDELLRLAVDNGVAISADTVAELHRISSVAGETGRRARVAPRLAPDPRSLPPTRFGELSGVWAEALTETIDNVDVVGVHVHLHGYGADDRVTALTEAMGLIDGLRPTHETIEFIDLGGGVPMSYLDDAQQWRRYQDLRADMVAGRTEPFTWKADPLNNTYPFHQSPVRGEWLGQILHAEHPDGTIASALTERGLRLHLEPGRSLLDGCGMTLMDVAFLKRRSDGVPLIGVAANRTQVRTTSDDYLVDPLLIRTQPAPGGEYEGYLVGAYCIEDEVILRRRMRFPQSLAPGDVIAVPNTAGYFMHILESASHQIPLAANVVVDDEGNAERDRIDG